VALVFLVVLPMLGSLVAQVADGSGSGGWENEEGRNPFGLVAVVGVVLVIGSVATTLAYRRLSRPVGDLLGAAERVAQGDYDVSVTPDGPRELRAFAATFNDMAAQLGATDEQRRRFLADITHELRTPLAILHGGIAAQIDGVHPRDDQHLSSLLEETERIGRLIEDLHTLALADAGRLDLHPEATDPTRLVEETLEAHTNLAEQKGVRLASSLPGAVPELHVDPVRIRQVLDNLLSNAVRHTPADQVVEVTAAVEHDPTSIRITVTDSGPGFPADQLPQVFDRFTRSADTRGSGLGLSIAHDLVKAHGGSIRASNNPDGGAVVSFTLPLDQPSPGV
jgi:signal transduction histidine kinase